MDENKNQTENKKSQALLFLEHLQTELQTIQSISEPALKLRMFALANDLISAKNYFRKLYIKAQTIGSPMIVINAWNEWAEGNYMEPDLTHGRGYIEALRKVVEEYKDK